MINPYPHQEKAILQIKTEWQKGNKKVLLVMDTGSGKTFTFCIMALAASKRNKRILILTDRILLITQTGGALAQAGAEFGIVNNGDYNQNILISTVGTAANRLDKIPTPDLVIIDEAHEGIFNKCLEWFPQAFFIGCTGTPIATNTKKPLKNYWDTAVCPIYRDELIKNETIVSCKLFKTKIDLAELERKGSDFSEESQVKVFGTENAYNALLNELKKAATLKTIVFCPSVSICKEMRERLLNEGFNAYCITGETKQKERVEILAKVKTQPDAILINCMVATKGFDMPSIMRAVLFFSTMSLAKYYQTVGRACRSFKDKSEAVIWDYGSNESRFWHPDLKVDWLSIFNNPKLSDGLAPIKNCKECDSIIHASAMICEFCQAEQPRTKKQQADLKKLELIESAKQSEEINLLQNQSFYESVETIKAVYIKDGVNACKKLAKQAGVIKAQGKPHTYWTRLAARAIFQAGGINMLKYAFGHLPKNYYLQLLTFAKK